MFDKFNLLAFGCCLFFVLQSISSLSIVPWISHGKNATKGQFPYQVVFVRRHAQMGQYIYSPFCGGSLINPSFVLTAAHCVIGEKSSDFMIFGGVVTTQDSNRTIGQPLKIAVHERYDHNKSLRNDIAIVKLQYPMFGKGIKTIKLPSLGTEPKNGSYPLIAGFGRTVPDVRSSFKSVLAFTTMTLLDPNYCLTKYFRRDFQICARGVGQGCGTCAGDSGGALVDPLSHTVIGLVSYGRGNCSSPSKLTVFTKVSAYEPWIRNKMSYL